MGEKTNDPGTADLRPSPPKQTTIDTIANPALLSTVWKKYIRTGLRSARLRDFYLAQDPVQFAAYEWGLTMFIARLSEELKGASYTPEPAVIIRGAKSTGLSRPLAVMSPRDALVYRTLVLRAEPDLKRDLRRWTGASMEDRDRLAHLAQRMKVEGVEPPTLDDEPTVAPPSPGARVVVDERGGTAPPGDADDATDDEEVKTTKKPFVLTETESYDDDWFQIWLSKQGIVAHICDTCPFVVESDIANFFTAIDLEVVREHLHSHTSLEKEAVRLVISLIRRTLPHPGYADSPTMGIPQEGFDSSRAIAHSLLVAVDRLFDREGEALLYSRFMDDFVIGVDTVDAGHRIIARLQRGLEPLGLYPNTAKTRVVSTERYLHEAMSDENAWLEHADTQCSELETGPLREIDPPVDLVAELTDRFIQHRNLADKPKRWDRVLRRYYVLLRRLGAGQFVGDALEDLRALPDSVTHLLEYIRSFPLSPVTAQELVSTAVDVADLYGDVPLLALETIGTAPNALSPGDHSAIADLAYRLVIDELSNSDRVERALSDRMIASTIPIISKFGDRDVCVSTVEAIASACDPKSHARIQASVMGAALGTPDQHLVGQALPGLRWDDVLALRYLDALTRGDDAAVGVALSLLPPQIRLMPNRYHVHTRPLMLLPLLRAVAPTKVAGQARSAIKQLGRNPERLRDHRAELLLEEALKPAG